MFKKKISSGVVHTVPSDVRQVVNSYPKVKLAWEDITPLARNEWICWIVSAKKMETRERRLKRMKEELVSGKRRPCCFGGCPHRSK